tara:strand:- start:416 stop:979 length:564 start_codon:yes stop_codon:yes gene_type:complete
MHFHFLLTKTKELKMAKTNEITKKEFKGLNDPQKTTLKESFESTYKSRDDLMKVIIKTAKDHNLKDLNRTERGKFWSEVESLQGKYKGRAFATLKTDINDKLGTGYKSNSGTPKTQTVEEVREKSIKSNKTKLQASYIQLKGLIGEDEFKKFLQHCDNEWRVVQLKAQAEAENTTKYNANRMVSNKK